MFRVRDPPQSWGRAQTPKGGGEGTRGSVTGDRFELTAKLFRSENAASNLTLQSGIIMADSSATLSWESEMGEKEKRAAARRVRNTRARGRRTARPRRVPRKTGEEGLSNRAHLQLV